MKLPAWVLSLFFKYIVISVLPYKGLKKAL